MTLRKKLFALFFLSGFCGLLYQVIWVRLAFSHFGVITPVLSVVVSVFMLGLSAGSWVAGRWGPALARRLRLSTSTLYGFTELIIGLSAFLVPSLFSLGDRLLLSGGDMNSASYLIRSALIMTAAILPWCFCMGATFPLMMAYIKERDPESQEGFSFLYLANVIGAVLGTILTANVLVELFGFRSTLAIAGFTNFCIAFGALTLPHTERSETSSNEVLHLDSSKVLPRERTNEKRGWLGLILFVTGFASMSAEVVWTRAFTPVLNTTIYAFALVLAIYLTATAVGSFLYRRNLRQGSVFSNATLAAWLAICAFLPLTVNDPRLDLRTFGVELGIFPLCALLGYLTPKLIDQFSQGNPDYAGRAYAINVVGCVMGPLFASYYLLPQWGVKASLVLLALPFVFIWLAYLPRLKTAMRVASSVATGGLLLAAVGFNNSYEEIYTGGIIRRDHTATVISAGQGRERHLYVNGQGITVLTTITKAMAHLPLSFLPNKPQSALTICFGMGTTFRSLLTWDIHVTGVELVPSVKDAFGYYHADAAAVLANPLGRIVIDDGRRFLKRTSDTFDLVTIDPPPPAEAAGSSLLYSTEFYSLLKERLTSQGILQQWFPGGEGPEAEAIARSLVKSFPYVRVYRSLEIQGLHFLASMQPLKAPTVQQFIDRLPPRARTDLVEWEPDGLASVAKRILSKEVPLETVLGSQPKRMITDDKPFNEYYWLRRNVARRWKGFTARHPSFN